MISAWLLLLTGLVISAVAIYYSVVGLTAIFAAAVVPIIIMGSALEVGKLVCASWLKENWHRAPGYMKYYMLTAVTILMIITSLGIFGFLSKAHTDQSLVSGDVQSKISIYDEKIRTERDNIDANRKALKQMDEAVDQVMGRSQDEKGADKAVAIRRAQQKERARLLADVAEAQKKITILNDQAAPIRAEVRKVEAEVGPIKYIAKLIYGDAGADVNMLERAVTWVIILIVVVFDPLAVIMLLAAQMTFVWRREELQAAQAQGQVGPTYAKDEDALAADQIEQIKATVEAPKEETSETPLTALGGDITAPEEPLVATAAEESELDKWNKMIQQADALAAQEAVIQEEAKRYRSQDTTDNRHKPDLTEVIEPNYDESKKKTYMTKDPTGILQVKSRD